MLNKAQIIGRLGADPELKTVSSGQSVCRLNVATNEHWVDRDGNKQEKTEWHRVTVWGTQAETCNQHLSKGREVYVEGKIQTRSWEDQQGVKRYTTEIVAQNVKFLGGLPNHAPGSDNGPSFDSSDEIPF